MSTAAPSFSRPLTPEVMASVSPAKDAFNSFMAREFVTQGDIIDRMAGCLFGRHRLSLADADGGALADRNLATKGWTASAHHCLDCGDLLWTVHVAPRKLSPDDAIERTKLSTIDAGRDPSRRSRRRPVRPVYQGSAEVTLSLLRALKYGDDIRLPQDPRFAT